MPGQGENRERGRKDCQELRRAPRGDGGTGPSYLRVNRIACATGKAKAPRWMRAVRGWRGCARRAFGHGMPCPYWKKIKRRRRVANIISKSFESVSQFRAAFAAVGEFAGEQCELRLIIDADKSSYVR